MGSESLSMHYIKSHIKDSIRVKEKILTDRKLLSTLENISQICVSAFRNGNKVIFAGNGGSAADSQHLAAEFVSRFKFDRPALPSLSLSTDTSMLTAISNDYGFEQIFSRQLHANGKQGDVFVGISTSGTSENIKEAFKQCKKLDIIPIGFSGKTGGDLMNITEHCLCIPSNDTAHIQECHIMLGHIICGYVEEILFNKE